MPDENRAPDPDCARRHPSAIVRFALIALVLLAADLVVKSWAFARVAGDPVAITRDANGDLVPIPPHEGIGLVPKLLELRLTVNEGAVFGLGHGGRWVFVVFTVIAIAVIGTVFARSPAKAIGLHLLLAAVLAGALGNLYDRLVFGVVRDMLHLFPGVSLPFGWTWPGGARGLYPWIFNVADVCLVVGLFALVFLMHRHEKRAAAAGDADGSSA